MNKAAVRGWLALGQLRVAHPLVAHVTGPRAVPAQFAIDRMIKVDLGIDPTVEHVPP